MQCECCGKSFSQDFIKGGRPRIYCSDSCRDFMKYLNAFQKSMKDIRFTSSASKSIRGDLFALSNTILHYHTD